MSLGRIGRKSGGGAVASSGCYGVQKSVGRRSMGKGNGLLLRDKRGNKSENE